MFTTDKEDKKLYVQRRTFEEAPRGAASHAGGAGKEGRQHLPHDQ